MNDKYRHIVDPRPTAEEELENAERAEDTDLKEVLARLEDRDRDVLELRFIQGLTNKEVAKSLGLSEQTTSMRLLRAKRRLKRLLDASRG